MTHPPVNFARKRRELDSPGKVTENAAHAGFRGIRCEKNVGKMVQINSRFTKSEQRSEVELDAHTEAVELNIVVVVVTHVLQVTGQIRSELHVGTDTVGNIGVIIFN